MNSFKSLLLASAAGLAVVGSASAADLPTKKAEPTAEYVRVCDAFGAGYFVIPGSDTCLKIGGVVRSETNYRFNAPSSNPTQIATNLAGVDYNRDAFYDRGRAYFNLSAASTTAYGPLTATLSMRFTNDMLPPGPFGGGKITDAATPSGKENAGLFQGLPQEQSYIDAAYVQWAGITAGVHHSFFDFYTHNYEIGSYTVAVSDQPLNLLAYTAKFGGFSATLSAEDPVARQIGNSAVDNSLPAAPKAAYLTYGGERSPDWVGQLHFDGSWGAAQIAGALHQVSATQVAGMTSQPSSKWGDAAEAGLKVNLDAISRGDSVTVQASYERGAMDYVNAWNYWAGTSNVYSHNLSISVPANDAFILPGNTIALQSAGGFFAGYQHYFSDEWHASVFGSYLQIHNPADAQLLSAGVDNARVWDLGTDLTWSPKKGFEITGEVVYTNLALSGAATLTATPPGISTPANSNDWRTRLRLQYTF